MKLRLDKYLADMGLGTRTEVKALLKKGCVTLNGEVVKKPDVKVDTETDKVFCHGQEVGYVEMEYLLLNKPAGVLTATEDRKQKTVLDLLDASVRKDVFPVGRLDKDTEGFLLITNDGGLAHELLSPKKHVPKRYYALVDGIMTEDDIRLFEEGLEIPAYEFPGNDSDGAVCVDENKTDSQEDYRSGDASGNREKGTGRAKKKPDRKSRKEMEMKEQKNDRFGAFRAMPARLGILSVNMEKQQSEVEIEVCEGKFHQVKRMCEAVGKRVLYLKRVSMGNIRLDENLLPGEYRKLSEQEVANLKKS